MGKGGGTPSQQTVTNTNVPEYLQPFMTDLANRATAASQTPYEKYPGERTAPFTEQQLAVQREMAGLGTPSQFGTATDFARTAGLGALSASQYAPAQVSVDRISAPVLTQYQMQAPADVTTQQYQAPQMGTARTGFAPQLERFQMAAPEKFGAEQAAQYMSPHQQAVTDIAKRQAVAEAQRLQTAANLGAARQGTYGGARQTLARTEREKALMQNLSDIQARGSQAAFESAQQQFERDRAAGMGAQRENLAAALGVQQLGTQTGLQAALANLSSEQQANVQNLAAQLQTQGLNADQALRAALANQQAGLTTAQQNLAARLGVQQLGTETGLRAALANQQYGLEGQRLAEQSRQYGAGLGMKGYEQLGAMGQLLGGLGTAEQTANLSRLAAQGNVAAQQQLMNQQMMDLAYQDYLARRGGYEKEQIGFLSGILRGIPGSTTTQSSAPPSIASQLIGLGGLGYGLSRLPGMAKGGLAGLAVHHLAGGN